MFEAYILIVFSFRIVFFMCIRTRHREHIVVVGLRLLPYVATLPSYFNNAFNFSSSYPPDLARCVSDQLSLISESQKRQKQRYFFLLNMNKRDANRKHNLALPLSERGSIINRVTAGAERKFKRCQVCLKAGLWVFAVSEEERVTVCRDDSNEISQ